MGKYAFYLKMNNGSRLAMDNLSRWMNAVLLTEGDCYILCDRDDVIQKVKDMLTFPETVTFLKSERASEETASITKGVIPQGGMVNACFAHLTTFLHARNQDYDFFWNIDADDTQLCMSVGRIAELLGHARDYAEKNKLDCFSLDMHMSRTGGKHWSFGVTYTKNRKDWLVILHSHVNDREYLEKDLEQRFNIDWYFTYIRSQQELRIETFYFENLKFIHYHFENIFADPTIWGLLHWKDNELRLPMLETFSSKESKLGRYPIPKDSIRLELEIEDREAENVMLFQGNWGGFVESIDFDYLVSEEALKRRRKAYFKKFNLKGTVACWGYGKCFKRVFSKISGICPVAYVCDSDERKWGDEYERCKVISPGELAQSQVSFVVITVLDTCMINTIRRQLAAYGITSYCHINEWLKLIV